MTKNGSFCNRESVQKVLNGEKKNENSAIYCTINVLINVV